jgi:peptidoglycan lytic transglycosylase
MFVPVTTPAQRAVPDVPLTPIEIPADQAVSSAAALSGLGAAPAHVRFKVRRVHLNVLEGHGSTIAGSLLAGRPAAGVPGRQVLVQALRRHRWHTIAKTRTRRGGRFRVRYVPRLLGREGLRLRFAGDATNLSAHRPLGRLDVYRLAEASWYGGGGSLACGGELTSATMGVANKTLPCGTMVTLRYRGRTVRVRVIDRGPYVAGREFDLTEATKYALGFGGTGEVWATR